MKFKGKTALVTGSSRGIGRSAAMRLAQEGAIVAIHCASNREPGEKTVKAITDVGGQAFLLQADMGVMGDVRRLAEETITEFRGRTGSDHLDILVNNAGISISVMPDAAEEAMFDKLVNTNLKGPLFLTQALIKHMGEGGRIINISSSTTVGVYPQVFLYTAVKSGLNNLTRSLAKFLGPRGITVNTIAPGATDTDMNAASLNDERRAMLAKMTPLGRIGEAEDLGDAIVLVASEDARWITGQFISADGGISLYS